MSGPVSGEPEILRRYFLGLMIILSAGGALMFLMMVAILGHLTYLEMSR